MTTPLDLGSFPERAFAQATHAASKISQPSAPTRQIATSEIAQQSKPPTNTDLAIAVLNGLDSNGRHDLATFDPPDCATFFFPNDCEKARRWIDARQGKTNLYVSVNRARKEAPSDKRLSGKDIATIRAIVADIDIPKKGDSTGEHFRELRAKLLNDVVPKLAKLECPPSLIVDSGGGVQLWWRLEEAVSAEYAALVNGIGRTINAQIAKAFPEFKLDTVTDLPRVMRLPGTINIPNERKRAEGRMAAPTTVLIEHAASCTLDELTAWAAPRARRSTSSNSELPNVDMAAVCAAMEYDELPGDLRAKFESACEELPSLRNLWNGQRVSWQNDISHSGFSYALAWALKRDGGFTATEFGQLLFVWDHGYEADKLNARRISRDWQNADPPTNTSSGFEAIEIGPRPSAKEKLKDDEDKKDEENETKPFVSLATPFSFPDPTTINPPDWILEGLAARAEVSTVTGPGGVSKSTWQLLTAVAAVTGREDICGFRIAQREGRPRRERVWVWNQEDSLDTMNARVLAIMEEFGVSPDDLRDENGKPMLFLNSGRGRGNRLMLVERKGDSFRPTAQLGHVIKTAAHEGFGGGFGVLRRMT
jgi:hypothetical protein